MRISDWSSDVCSSDLAASAASFCLRTWPGARQSSRLKPLLQGCLAQAKRRHWLPAFASRPGASDSRRGRLLLFAQAVGRVGAGKRAELAQRGFDPRAVGRVGLRAVADVALLDEVRGVAHRAGGVGEQRLPLCRGRSEEHTSELQSLMRISYAVVPPVRVSADLQRRLAVLRLFLPLVEIGRASCRDRVCQYV